MLESRIDHPRPGKVNKFDIVKVLYRCQHVPERDQGFVKADTYNNTGNRIDRNRLGSAGCGALESFFSRGLGEIVIQADLFREITGDLDTVDVNDLTPSKCSDF